MNLYLFLIPGGLFLLVVFFRAGLPYLKTPAWKRLIDSARYNRHMEKFEKSDEILEKALKKFPDRPEVYLEYFLNHSESTDLEKRVDVLRSGFERTGDTVLAFFLGNAHLENGDFETARRYIDTDDCRLYMIEHKIPLIAQVLYEEGRYQEAEEEFFSFYRRVFNASGTDDVLEDLSAQELVLYVLILKARGGDWRSVMKRIPKTSFHSDMSWKDYLSMLQDEYRSLEPATTGIKGDPSEFNRRRNEFFRERISLVESYL